LSTAWHAKQLFFFAKSALAQAPVDANAMSAMAVNFSMCLSSEINNSLVAYV
jgi:hypothetical protein